MRPWDTTKTRIVRTQIPVRFLLIKNVTYIYEPICILWRLCSRIHSRKGFYRTSRPNAKQLKESFLWKYIRELIEIYEWVSSKPIRSPTNPPQTFSRDSLWHKFKFYYQKSLNYYSLLLKLQIFIWKVRLNLCTSLVVCLFHI